MKIGLTGTNCAGKGTVADYLVSKGYEYYSLSDEIRLELRRRGLEETRDNLRDLGNELRNVHGYGVLAEMLSSRVSYDAVIDSIRHPMEVEALRGFYDFVMVSVDAPIELRYERAKERGREENASSLEEFRQKEELEKGEGGGQQIHRTMEASDYILFNDSNMDGLQKKIDDFLVYCKKP